MNRWIDEMNGYNEYMKWIDEFIGWNEWIQWKDELKGWNEWMNKCIRIVKSDEKFMKIQ